MSFRDFLLTQIHLRWSGVLLKGSSWGFLCSNHIYIKMLCICSFPHTILKKYFLEYQIIVDMVDMRSGKNTRLHFLSVFPFNQNQHPAGCLNFILATEYSSWYLWVLIISLPKVLLYFQLYGSAILQSFAFQNCHWDIIFFLIFIVFCYLKFILYIYIFCFKWITM